MEVLRGLEMGRMELLAGEFIGRGHTPGRNQMSFI